MRQQCCHYVNRGEAYAWMVCHTSQGYAIDTWGDWFQQTEAEHCEAENEIRCAYCGKFTPLGEGDWHETVCEHCDHYVDGGGKLQETPKELD